MDRASQLRRRLHLVLFPLMAPGHMIPMIDIAKLLAHQPVEVVVSLISTPQNAARFGSTIARAGPRLRLVQVRFPAAEAGLPEGCENLDSLPSQDLATNFFVAVNLLQNEVAHVLEEMDPRPSCIISDMGLPWTTQISERLQIPRIVFHGTSCFSLLCSHNIRSSGVLETLASDTDTFEVPNLPDRIVLRKGQVSGTMIRKTTVVKDLTNQIRSAEKSSYGVVVNSFQELEEEYVKQYSAAKGEKVWCVGPVSLCNKEVLDLAERGNRTAAGEKDCLEWLDQQSPGSVIYASLGSLARLAAAQLTELALGLEASGKPFIWALGGVKSAVGFEEWMLDNGFEHRNRGRGVVIRGWAPQVVILGHRAIGGFVTHCGWNSTLEGIAAGVPMVTWPRFADQFCNEKLVVEVLGIAVSLGVEKPMKWGEEEEVGVVVRKEDVEKAVALVMDDGGDGEERRRKARELGEIAKRAMEEGGSSFGNILHLVQDIMEKLNHEC